MPTNIVAKIGPCVQIPLDALIRPDRGKEIDCDRVSRLAESIEADGLIVPLVVMPTEAGYLILSGAHRYYALQDLVWGGDCRHTLVDCVTIT